ncbi:hypothetical protein LCY76_09415 [Fictibacillus sp. KIGAM418]|uniref:Uncharacterized protein n=1 Tax=Fictibacillus marinisediminis TaxID=2878389 RepID=A0A9X2BF31_9BACL|nr:hypothetical protein [Fictibacillus marinisediminis]MCK6256812.1 hypothetical protein [Fictibacillus marinisediminis]
MLGTNDQQPGATDPALADQQQPGANGQNPGAQDDDRQSEPLTADEKSELISLRKMSALATAGISDPEDVSNALQWIEGAETVDEIQSGIDRLLCELRISERSQGVDPSPGNGRQSPPKPRSREDVGRKLYQRIKDRRIK